METAIPLAFAVAPIMTVDAVVVFLVIRSRRASKYACLTKGKRNFKNFLGLLKI